MTKKISLFVVTAAATALMLSACGRGPGTDPMPVAPSLDGTWVFAGFSAMIDGTDVTVTVGDGTMPVSTDPAFAAVTKVEVKSTLAVAGTAYTLTLADGADAIDVTVAPAAPPGSDAVAEGAIKTLIEGAQGGAVMITVDEAADPATMTVTGSFIDTIMMTLGMQVPEGGLMACKGVPCATS